ncbi:MAG: matrixin family metalloprotease [Sphingomonas sp.]|nr:matrixin family metalloprotease [Sphingomonas sp.]
MANDNPFMLVDDKEVAKRKRERLFRYGKNKNIICITDTRATLKNEWRTDSKLVDAIGRVPGAGLAEIVVDASEGFLPLWAEHSTLRWRFNELSMQAFADPAAAKRSLEALFLEAVGRWDTACPVKFVRDDARYDFEIVMRSQKRCSTNGCVLAAAFFPDGGQHEIEIYPSMFEQTKEEQLETLVHEIGHVFGLRHFFALISETAWPAIVYGKHKKFSIMNYGSDSRLTPADKADLKKLYKNVWSGKIAALNATPVRLMRPFSSQFL